MRTVTGPVIPCCRRKQREVARLVGRDGDAVLRDADGGGGAGRTVIRFATLPLTGFAGSSVKSARLAAPLGYQGCSRKSVSFR